MSAYIPSPENPFPAGDTFRWKCVATDDDSGEPIPLGGLTISAKFKSAFGTVSPDFNVIDAAAGEFELVDTDEVTAAWAPGVYLGDISLVGEAGTFSTVEMAFPVRIEY